MEGWSLDLSIILTVAGCIFSLLLWLFKPDFIKNVFKRQKVTGFVKSRNLSDDFTIAIIDDELDSYPIVYIQSLGYKVKTFESVSFSQAEEISKFDLILLDVKGVVKEDLEEGGAKIIKIIKDYRPLVPIVSVSSGYFHTELNDYFKTCDDNVRKPIDEFKIREIISDLKLEFYDGDNLSKLINDDIQALHLSKNKKNKISLFVIKYLKDDIEIDELKVFLHKVATIKTDDLLCNINKLKERILNA